MNQSSKAPATQARAPAKAQAGQIDQRPRKVKFSDTIRSSGYQTLIKQAVGGSADRAARFTSAITSAVSINPALQNCTPNTILSAALLGEALKLSPSPQLGQYYMVPFDKKENGVVVETNATFILGYKGYIQLALRSGKYKSLNCMEIREGEYLGKDPETGEPRFRYNENDDIREGLSVVGYMASFQLVNGFSKALYWSREKMLKHADKYSQTFSRVKYEQYLAGKIPKSEERKFTSNKASQWYKDFDSMALKTMLRQLLGKWGPLSPDMESAYEHDNNVIGMEGQAFVNETYATAETEPEPEIVEAEVIDAPPEEPESDPIETEDGQEMVDLDNL